MGLRPGEAVALRHNDARDGWLTIARRLPIPDELATWIEAHPARAPGAPLFPNPRTRVAWTPTSLRRAWSDACKSVGVSISLYEGTKHTFATDAALRGVPERSLQAFLGHADARSTRKYARLADGALVDVLHRVR